MCEELQQCPRLREPTMSIWSRISVIQMRVRRRSTYWSPPWFKPKVTILPSSCPREKRLLAVDRAREVILDIGAILGISEKRRRLQAKKTMRKLRRQAKVKAVHLGLIALPDGMLATNPVR
jgi:hypothetical protein